MPSMEELHDRLEAIIKKKDAAMADRIAFLEKEHTNVLETLRAVCSLITETKDATLIERSGKILKEKLLENRG